MIAQKQVLMGADEVLAAHRPGTSKGLSHQIVQWFIGVTGVANGRTMKGIVCRWTSVALPILRPADEEAGHARVRGQDRRRDGRRQRHGPRLSRSASPAKGMQVVLADIEEEALKTAVRELEQEEHRVIGVVTNTMSRDSVQALARRAIDEFGKVHILCNNAGRHQSR